MAYLNLCWLANQESFIKTLNHLIKEPDVPSVLEIGELLCGAIFNGAPADYGDISSVLSLGAIVRHALLLNDSGNLSDAHKRIVEIIRETPWPPDSGGSVTAATCSEPPGSRQHLARMLIEIFHSRADWTDNDKIADFVTRAAAEKWYYPQSRSAAVKRAVPSWEAFSRLGNRSGEWLRLFASPKRPDKLRASPLFTLWRKAR